jgi:hypothetical protein
MKFHEVLKMLNISWSLFTYNVYKYTCNFETRSHKKTDKNDVKEKAI